MAFERACAQRVDSEPVVAFGRQTTVCAIVDNDVRDEVFGAAQSGAGKLMFDWLTEGKGRLVVGGPLLRELAGSGNFLRWMKAAQRSGRVVRVADHDVETESRQLEEGALCRSNDTHVVALAKQSGSRLLFTNDIELQRDFKNPKIINSPRGVIYTTRRGREASDVHRRMLTRRNLCRSSDNA